MQCLLRLPLACEHNFSTSLHVCLGAPSSYLGVSPHRLISNAQMQIRAATVVSCLPCLETTSSCSCSEFLQKETLMGYVLCHLLNIPYISGVELLICCRNLKLHSGSPENPFYLFKISGAYRDVRLSLAYP